MEGNKQQTKANPCDYVLNKVDTINSISSSVFNAQNLGNLFLGGIDTLCSSQISNHKINAVLTIMTQKQQRKTKLDRKIDELDDINKHITLMCHDENPLIGPYFIPAIQFIRDSMMYNFNVLIHCKQGNARSAALIVAYVMYKFKLKYDKAQEIVKLRRPSINIPQNYREQLKQYQQKLHSFK